MRRERIVLRRGEPDDTGTDWLELGAVVDDASADVQPAIDADAGTRSVTVEIPRSPMTARLAQGTREEVTHFLFREEYWRLLSVEHAALRERGMRLVGQAVVA